MPFTFVPCKKLESTPSLQKQVVDKPKEDQITDETVMPILVLERIYLGS